MGGMASFTEEPEELFQNQYPSIRLLSGRISRYMGGLFLGGLNVFLPAISAWSYLIRILILFLAQ